MALFFNPVAPTCSGPEHKQLHVLASEWVSQEVLSLFLGIFQHFSWRDEPERARKFSKI